MATRTPSQQKRIDGIRRRLEHSINEFFEEPTYEIYEWEEKDFDRFVSIVARVDLIGSKYHNFPRIYQVFVGRKGGVKQVVKGMKAHQTGFRPWQVAI
jgi:hypothetical protein